MSALRVNAVGDLVLTDPEAMRTLAAPGRLALLDRLRSEGPATAAELSAESPQLEELERHGFVTRVERGWEAVGKGFVFEIPEDPAGEAAARELSKAMMARYVRLPEQWLAEDEPRLELEWARAAGLLNARVTVTADELRGLQDGLERLLEPVITREPDHAPTGARPARILAYFLPQG